MTPPRTADEELLHALGYKQEFKREFTAFEVFGTPRVFQIYCYERLSGIAFSVIGLLPSMASVLFYAVPNGGLVGMVQASLRHSSLDHVY